ncbi:MAG: TonB-dependent siderophore receptor [Leptolyngbyaceae cyanobacterium CSU_1_3]|nr:TonB-dependent siderophore receptor [Leptolyngbyaceae cyanobacterium CSU_1_3]
MLEQGLRVQNLAWMLSILSVFVTSIAAAAEPTTVRELPATAKTVKEWVAQVEAATVQVTAIRVVTVENRLQVQIETADGRTLQATTRTEGNTLIAEITNAVLALPSGQSFRAEKPTIDITEITATQINASTVQIRIVGDGIAPVAEVVNSDRGLVLSVEPDEDAVAEEEITVTGAGQRGYRVPNASTATRTDTPIRDIPASIQVIPQQVIKDQGATTLSEVLQNVPGVSQGIQPPRSPLNAYNIRGFSAELETLVNGLSVRTNQGVTLNPNIDRIEVIKEPASVLFGQGGLGGRVNYITKQPLRDPFYSIEASVGSYSFYRGAIDLSGSLNSENVLYRLNASAQTTESFIDFFDQQTYVVAPVITWLISDQTTLTLESEYQKNSGIDDYGLPAEGTILPNPNGKISRSRFLGDPSLTSSDSQVFRIGYDFKHSFSDNWQVRSVFRASLYDRSAQRTPGLSLLDDKRTLERFYGVSEQSSNVYNLDNFVVGKFSTGSVQHQLVVGFNLFREDFSFRDEGPLDNIASIDLFNPVYGVSIPEPSVIYNDSKSRTQAQCLYLQDQLALAENLKLLLGGRFDIASQTSEDVNFFGSTNQSQQDEAFSPRIGIVYNPIKPVSLYASYSRSFNPVTGTTRNGAQFKPERGTQYEIGLKADLSSTISSTIAFFDLIRSNVTTEDPDNPGFSIQTGEQRSKGIELDLSGEILPGWNIIAGYALTNAEITKDNTFAVGNQLINVPKHALNLWTTYEIQSGRLQGLGIGAGVFYVGEREGDLNNSFEIPSYVRTDAAVFYRRGNFRAAINIKNLFDVDYFASARSRTRIYYGDPLTVIGSISWQF